MKRKFKWKLLMNFIKHVKPNDRHLYHKYLFWEIFLHGINWMRYTKIRYYFFVLEFYSILQFIHLTHFCD